jgi:hypothetical protein
MLITKEELSTLVSDVKSLKDRTEAAELKVKTLEEEKAAFIAGKGWSPNIGGSNINSDEKRALSYFGKSHPKELLELNVGDRDYRYVPDELKHLVLTFKKSFDIGRFIAQRFYGDALDFVGIDPTQDRRGICKSVLETYYGKNVLVPMLKAFGTTVVGGGAEWVPTAVSTSYLEEYELERKLERQFQLIKLPFGKFDQPKLKNATKARIATEGQTNFAGANWQTDKISFDAVKLEEFYILPTEITEDSAPDFLAAARSEVVYAQERAAESAMISGDSDGTHIDSDTQAGGADLAEKAWDGFRKLAIANSANGATYDFNGVADETKIATLIGRMGKFGVNPQECLILMGAAIYTQVRHLDSVTTVEKFGPQATVLTGVAATYQGMPIIVSDQYREDLNATGVYDGVTTTKAAISIVNKKRFYLGQRRPIAVKLIQDLPGNDRWLMASYRRVDFQGHAQGAVEKSVVYGYNITK